MALRAFIRSHQRLAYHALFQASSTARKRLAKDERFLGTHLPGFTGILHTWGRQLQFHPHLHDIVPGGGLSQDASQWLPSRTNFFVPVKALSPIYRAIFQEEMHRAELLSHIDPQVWNMPWNVAGQPTRPHGLEISRPFCLQSGHIQQPNRGPQGPHRHLHVP